MSDHRDPSKASSRSRSSNVLHFTPRKSAVGTDDQPNTVCPFDLMGQKLDRLEEFVMRLGEEVTDDQTSILSPE